MVGSKNIIVCKNHSFNYCNMAYVQEFLDAKSIKDFVEKDRLFRNHVADERYWSITDAVPEKACVTFGFNGYEPGTMSAIDFFKGRDYLENPKDPNFSIELSADKSYVSFTFGPDLWAYTNFFAKFMPSYYRTLVYNKLRGIIRTPRNWSKDDNGWLTCRFQPLYLNLKGSEICDMIIELIKEIGFDGGDLRVPGPSFHICYDIDRFYWHPKPRCSCVIS